MSFNSIGFITIFLLLFIILYYCLNCKLQNVCLLIFSLLFYSWNKPIYLLVIIGSSLINFLLAKKIADKKKVYLIFGIVFNLGLLLAFKYGDVIADLLEIRLKDFTMPIGISFFTFQSIAYLVDCYTSKIEKEDNFFNYLLAITMFAKVTNGPIVRYGRLKEQMENHQTNLETLTSGTQRFIEGLFKKVLLADSLGQLASDLLTVSSSALLTNWLYIIAYTLQIYFDFSGYSDMAIGLAKICGYDFDENFNYPYSATSITDFWRRWHISLSTFFRDYLYIPLGGNRVSTVRHIINILIVWIATGLWHGSSLNFIAWGLYYGILLLIEKYLFKNILEKMPMLLRHFMTIILVMIGWLLFSINDFRQLFEIFTNLFNFKLLYDDAFVYYLKNYAFEIIVAILLCGPTFKKWLDKKHNVVVEIIIVVITLLLLIIVYSQLVANTYSPFLYNNF